MAAGWERMVESARERVPEVAPPAVWTRLQANDVTVLDVREPDEVAVGQVPGAVTIPRGLLEMRVEAAVGDKTRPVVVYCAGGNRSLVACATLMDMGYRSVASLAGGFAAWKTAGLPCVFPPSGNSRARYSRHLRLPEVGEAGQRKLLDSRVLVVGAGGLGSTALLYLAAAGVGHITLVDADRVDITNLQRQIVHTTRNVGLPKVQSAREALHDLNPDVNVDGHTVRLDRHNAESLVAGHDVVVDGCDNFATRYLVSDVCVKLGIPNVYASVFRFDGQTSVFLPRQQGPCYRCLYPQPPPAGLAPSCDEAGVLGVLPGLLGIVQATEALKLIVGIGRPLCGRLLCYDALDASFREFRVERNPRCPACGDEADPDGLIATAEDGPACPTAAPDPCARPRRPTPPSPTPSERGLREPTDSQCPS